MHLLRYLLCAASASQPHLTFLPPPRPNIPPAAPPSNPHPAARPAILTPPRRPGSCLPLSRIVPAGSAGQPDAPEPANLGHSPFGQPIGGHRGRHALFIRQREDLLGGHVDLLGPYAG